MKFRLQKLLLWVFLALTLIPSSLFACMSENSRQGSTTVLSLFSPGEESPKPTQATRFPGIFTSILHQVSDTWWYGKYYAATLSPHLYTGRRFSPVTGLYNLRNRYYQPKYGRFYSSDPIGFLGGQNRYGYARNNPMRWVDPFGLCTAQLNYPALAPSVPDPRAQTQREFFIGPVSGKPISVEEQQEINRNLQFDSSPDLTSLYNNNTLDTSAKGRGVKIMGNTMMVVQTGFALRGLISSLGAETSILGSQGANTPLWRAVNPTELADIQKQGLFRNLGSAEGKYFSTTADGASSYAKQAYYGFKDPPYTLIKTEAPKDLLEKLGVTTVDRNVPAVVVPNEALPLLKPQVLNYFPLPPR
ncbi:MAG: RHS repeat-associated core domain-containing protein [Candidatus Riflebacteria bacterium]|nr:RHS repeat-associated core domain-containing protein [Candidatus Riflebacteria bacterium]